MPHAHHAGFQSGQVALTLDIVLLALILVSLIYVRGWFRIHRLDPDTVDGWHGASFLLGMFCIWLAVASPLAAFDHQLLTVHMVQHLLLMTIAAPLIWLGAPATPLLYGLPRRFAQVAGSWFRLPSVQCLGKAIAHPTVCWLAATGTLVGWHIPSLFMLGMQSEVWHGIEQASFLASGLLFWWPVIRPWPAVSTESEWSNLLYLFLATLPCDILSGFLVFCDRVVYPAYFSSPHALGFSALEDQQCAGALMWTCVTVVYLIAGTIVAARLLSPESLRQYPVVPSGLPVSSAPQTTRQTVEVV